jgi:CRP/FNR family transcriptional regulator, cyclic AMP receptor protein
MSVFTKFRREWSINDVAKLVRSHERFSMLSEQEAVMLVQHMHPLRLDAGGTVFREGRADTNFMAIILDGEAKAETDGGGVGKKVTLGTLKNGDLIGEQGILQETPRSATVTATTEMMLAAIDAAKFGKLIKSKPELGCTILMSLLKTVTLRLFESNQRVHVLDESNRTLKKDLDLEIASRPKLRPEDIPPLVATPEMFMPPEAKKA